MPQQEFKRKLTTILSADVVGYSRLMSDDEEATVHTIKAYRKVVESLIVEHRGRLVDSPGDNMLAEFASVVDGLRCAWDIQNEIQSRNSNLPEARRMVFRIGINLGDVIEEEGRIYGDGVNVAARLESLAEPGGISIAGAVYNHVEKKVPFRYEDQGEQSVKNIDKPVQVYRVLMDTELPSKEPVKPKPASRWRRNLAIALGVLILLLAGGATYIWDTYFRIPDVASLTGQNEEFKLPEGPSIAVLPFDNMSGDPEQEYICDGLTENIIISLSYNSQLFVISRKSTFYFKDKSSTVQDVAAKLGADYVLEGSFQKAEDRVRITVQLIDANTGHHIWAERYDRKFKNLFDLQDEITEKIYTALAVKLTDGERARIFSKYPASFDARLIMMRAWGYVGSFNEEDNISARYLAEQALALSPMHPQPYIILSWTYAMGLYFAWDESPLNSMAMAIKYAKSAIEIDENNPDAYILLGFVANARKDHEKAITMLERAIILSPNYDEAYCQLGVVYMFADMPEKGLDFVKKAISLSPIPPAHYLMHLGNGYRILGQYKEAVVVLNKALDREPDNFLAHVFLVISYSLSGQDDKARSEVKTVYKIDPNFSLKQLVNRWPIKNPDDKKQIVDACNKVGLK
jgi:adenylate cyclase